MNNIRNMSIWKKEENKTSGEQLLSAMDIAELNLSVRSYNCLKRAGCSTVGDVLALLDEEGNGLKKIRNLGSRSEAEILQKIEEQKALCKDMAVSEEPKKKHVIKPARSSMKTMIGTCHLSRKAMDELTDCGIVKIGDLYQDELTREPGWYAVRELFEKVPVFR